MLECQHQGALIRGDDDEDHHHEDDDADDDENDDDAKVLADDNEVFVVGWLTGFDEKVKKALGGIFQPLFTAQLKI